MSSSSLFDFKLPSVLYLLNNNIRFQFGTAVSIAAVSALSSSVLCSNSFTLSDDAENSDDLDNESNDDDEVLYCGDGGGIVKKIPVSCRCNSCLLLDDKKIEDLSKGAVNAQQVAVDTSDRTTS